MKLIKIILAMAGLVATPIVTIAGEASQLTINEEPFVTSVAAPAHLENVDTIYSGWTFRTDETQALQMDDFDNPAFVFIDQAIDTFNTVDGSAGKACVSCHESPEVFKGLRASMPRVNGSGELETIPELVNNCRTERMGAEKWKWSGGKMAGMVGLIGLQSRGMTVDVAINGPASSMWEKGKELYYQRVGQLDMSCSNCHEDNYGNMIRADHLSQGQINGFPTYRLKNAKLNTIHGRFKGCMKNISATTFKEGSEEFKALELYVASRANGLSVETPSVRN